MNKLLFLILALTSTYLTPLASKKDSRYVDAKGFTVINRAQTSGDSYRRLDTEKFPALSPKVALYLNFPTGVALKFRTNSEFINAKWVTTDTLNGWNRMPISSRGLDLYIKKGGKWTFAGVSRPNYTGTRHASAIIADMDTTMKECMLYLPLFINLKSLKIGVSADSKIESDGGFERSPIIAIGSSLTHGTGTSRPGMAWPAQLSRRLGVNIANLGTSGIQKMQPFFGELAAKLDADCFIFDTFSNPTAEEIEERFIPFLQSVRASHPTTPLIFIETLNREGSNFSERIRTSELKKKETAKRLIEQAMKSDPNLYYIAPGFYLGDDHEGSSDGTHPSDLGYKRAVDNIEPHIRAILNKYNIKITN